MFVVCVTFDLREGTLDDAMPLFRKQAAASLDREPDCRRFDVCVDEGAGRVFLYEIYTDRASFDVHLATDHFAAFDAAIAAFVADKAVATYHLDGTAAV
ncbi:putative quinol monooxygenase [Jannaschia sp. LMIT008]|uniref:putative quinol monooxygenase n=1 Tax=Jannaschia maritima TaxID=3032585 RepID=UPI0028126213|nr:antibiotic biosynthesis monooxygenase [Jannaschia sp. LMIT008]